MKKSLLSLFFWFLSFSIRLLAQDWPPNDMNSAATSGQATAASRFASTPVNFYTGIPDVSIPIYNYEHHNGLNLNISLRYMAGGVKVNETPTPAGLGWYLDAGGVISRTVRGMPDDISENGFMYSHSLPDNYYPNGSKYYHDSIDAQQDIFQFNFNGRAGKFFIGKNKQIVTVPLTKMTIGYVAAAGNNTPITSFYIINESGVKYVFSELETQRISNPDFRCGYNNINYTTAWYLSRIIAPFATDTIRFNYTAVQGTHQIAFPQTAYINNNNLSVYRNYKPVGTEFLMRKKLASVELPDKKKVSIIYNGLLKYDGEDSVIDKITISDTAFRYGYLFRWWPSSVKAYLNNIYLYTSTAVKPLFWFDYGGQMLPAIGSAGDTLNNKRDHWGFYNGANNGTNAIPTVPGIYNGANRNPAISTLAGSLGNIYDLSGTIDNYTGQNLYVFEPNDIWQYNTLPQTVIINANNSSSTSIALSQLFNDRYDFTVSFENSNSDSPPFTGSCDFTCTVKSTDGLITYATYTTNLNDLWYGGIHSFSFDAPSGNYLLETNLSGCSVNLNPLAVSIKWQNQVSAGNNTIWGGIRIKHLIHYDAITLKRDTIASYQYVQEDGKSSGFLSAVPIYHYPYQETVVNGATTTTNYIAISSDPINNLNYTQGSPVGYSRVIVYNGGFSHNSGKTVYEFTNFEDANANITAPYFPYAPTVQPDWGLGLPKRISIYDSLGRLISIKRDSFAISTITMNDANFKNLKLGKTGATYYGNPASSETPVTEHLAGQFYYPQTGRSERISSTDSVFHLDGSVQISRQEFQYDANYNLVKVISPYDLTRGLKMENRLYYPYNYTITAGGLKVLKDNNIISPVIASESWVVGDGSPRMINASVTDFQQLPQGHVKPLRTYSLQSNAPVSQSVIGLFDPASLIRNSTYLIPQQNFISYDSKGRLIEMQNVASKRSSSVILDYSNQFPVAEVSNAAYGDIAYTSFESDGVGNWSIGGSTRNSSFALTGKLSYELSSGNITKAGLSAFKSYLLTVWGRVGTSITVNGNSPGNPIAAQNGWNLYQVNLSSITSVTLSGSGLIDELRLHPKEANMITTTYEPMVGPTSSCDANNTVSYFLYDKLNRMHVIKDKDLHIIKKYEYGDSLIYISTSSVWKSQTTQCQTPRNGNVDSVFRDINPYSSTYNTTRTEFAYNDCVRCGPICNSDPKYKLVNCQCEAGTRCNDSVVRIKVGSVFYWRCTYHYEWSDCSVSPSYTEDNTAPCTLNLGPCWM